MLGNESSMLILMVENENSQERKFYLWNFRSWKQKNESSWVRKF